MGFLGFILSVLALILLISLVTRGVKSVSRTVDKEQEKTKKKCPDCAEFVQPGAKICRFCQHKFEEEKPKTEAVLESAEGIGPQETTSGAAIGVILLIIIMAVFFGGALLVMHTSENQTKESREEAVGSLRTIDTAAVTYSATYDGYPPSLASLGPPANGAKDSAKAAGFIDSVLASGAKENYVFTYVAGPEVRHEIETYTVHADPAAKSDDAVHYFTDESDVIRFEVGHPANANSEPLVE
jgi:uncharacterized OB-fold protein